MVGAVHCFWRWMVKQIAMAIENLDRRAVAEGYRDDTVRLPAAIRWYECSLGADTGDDLFMVSLFVCFPADTFDGAISNKL